MKIKTSLFLCLLALAAIVLLGAPMAANAAHPNVTVLDANGGAITNGTTPYSTKQTCSGCHFDCRITVGGALSGSLGSYSTNTFNFCQNDAARTAWFNTAPSVTVPLIPATTGNCNVRGRCPDYESMQVKTATQNVGLGTPAGVVFQDQTVTVPVHGISQGKHSTQGLDQDLTAAQKAIWGVPAFASGTGMFGRF